MARGQRRRDVVELAVQMVEGLAGERGGEVETTVGSASSGAQQRTGRNARRDGGRSGVLFREGAHVVDVGGLQLSLVHLVLSGDRDGDLIGMEQNENESDVISTSTRTMSHDRGAILFLRFPVDGIQSLASRATSLEFLKNGTHNGLRAVIQRRDAVSGEKEELVI